MAVFERLFLSGRHTLPKSVEKVFGSEGFGFLKKKQRDGRPGADRPLG
jgi:hypothetical protein